jgi:uncharacterized protein YodC (DUF2158 family)
MKQIGDLVRLKSGGLLMTVTDYHSKSGYVVVCWHSDGGTPEDATYPEGAVDGPFQVKYLAPGQPSVTELTTVHD